jgi:hypothetical protein
MRSFAIAALISAVAASASVETIYSTTTDSVISCAPDITDCPGRSSTVYSYHATETSTTCTTTDEAHPTTSSAPAYTWTSSAPVQTWTSSAPVYTWTSTADAHPTASTSTCTDEEEHATETGAVKTWETQTKPSKPTHYATITGATGGKASASASSGGMFEPPSDALPKLP